MMRHGLCYKGTAYIPSAQVAAAQIKGSAGHVAQQPL